MLKKCIIVEKLDKKIISILNDIKDEEIVILTFKLENQRFDELLPENIKHYNFWEMQRIRDGINMLYPINEQFDEYGEKLFNIINYPNSEKIYKIEKNILMSDTIFCTDYLDNFNRLLYREMMEYGKKTRVKIYDYMGEEVATFYYKNNKNIEYPQDIKDVKLSKNYKKLIEWQNIWLQDVLPKDLDFCFVLEPKFQKIIQEIEYLNVEIFYIFNEKKNKKNHLNLSRVNNRKRLQSVVKIKKHTIYFYIRKIKRKIR